MLTAILRVFSNTYVTNESILGQLGLRYLHLLLSMLFLDITFQPAMNGSYQTLVCSLFVIILQYYLMLQSFGCWDGVIK
jgi:hypothetical protein